MVQLKDITLNCDESLHLELEELGNVMHDFIEQEVMCTGEENKPAFPPHVIRALAEAEDRLMQASYVVYLYYSRKNREELKVKSNPA